MLAAAVILYDGCMASRAVADADNWQKHAGRPYFDAQGTLITACAAAPVYGTLVLQVVSVSTPLVRSVPCDPSPASTASRPYVQSLQPHGVVAHALVTVQALSVVPATQALAVLYLAPEPSMAWSPCCAGAPHLGVIQDVG